MHPPIVPPVNASFEEDPLFILLDRDVARLQRVRGWRRRLSRRCLPSRTVRAASEARP